MISKIILCKQPLFLEDEQDMNHICGAILIFKKDMPFARAYCGIVQEGENLYIETKGWSLLDECLIRKIQLYVRNKMSLIESGQLPSYEKAVQKADHIITQNMSSAEKEFYLFFDKHDELSEFEIEESAEFTEFAKRIEQESREINDRVNREWSEQQ
ncbi:MAG: hypothetical protein ACI35P_02630 [Bacillus sp. (in: firmicutes)]